MTKNYDESVEVNHNVNWPYIPDHPYRILVIGGSGSGKTNVLLNVIKPQRPDTDKICLIQQRKRKETQYFTCFCITILFQSA